MYKFIHVDIFSCFYDDILSGVKTWELREMRDRDFSTGDTLIIHDPDLNRSLSAEITYVMREGFGLKNGWCIMSIKLIKELL